MNQQLSMFDMMMPAPALVLDAPTWFKTSLDKKGWSYARIGIAPNGDGTWAYSTADNFGGYCGHDGPFHGAYRSFDEALEIAVGRLHGGWKQISERMNDSCCGEKHRAMAKAGLDWLASLRDGHPTAGGIQ